MTDAVITVADTPPSMNTNRIRSNWRGFHTEKKRWQQQLEVLLMASRLPRPLPAVGPVHVEATLRFPDRRRRDSENFRVLLSKALGDALVNGGWLVDDTDEDWRLSVVQDRERGPARTLIRLSWVDEASQEAA